jgi:hypothetical protein
MSNSPFCVSHVDVSAEAREVWLICMQCLRIDRDKATGGVPADGLAWFLVGMGRKLDFPQAQAAVGDFLAAATALGVIEDDPFATKFRLL